MAVYRPSCTREMAGIPYTFFTLLADVTAGGTPEAFLFLRRQRVHGLGVIQKFRILPHDTLNLIHEPLDGIWTTANTVSGAARIKGAVQVKCSWYRVVLDDED